MTGDQVDTNAIRRVYGEPLHRPTIWPLCDALDEARAERDRAEEQWAEWFHRGTKAEAQVAAVRALLSESRFPDEHDFSADEIAAALDGAS